MDANAYKAKGNEAFSAKNFPAAIAAFSEAIKLDETNHVLYSNRSASYASLQEYSKALTDAQKCVEIKDDWSKGYIRLGAAYHGLKQYDQALEAYNKGLKLEPSNASLKDGVKDVEKDKAALARNPFARVFTKDCIPKIHSNPKIAPYMMQPDFIQLLQKIIEDPMRGDEYTKDQRLVHVFMELSGISVPLKEDDDDDEPRPKPKPAPKAAAPKPAAVENSEALKLKDEGNALYREHKFDEALEKYDAAFKVEPATTFLLNKTAVYFEKGDYDTCISECEKAIDHGRETKADYTIGARLMTRKALCYQKMKKYEEAVAGFKHALVEHRNPDTLAKLHACEKEKKAADEEAYYDPAIAEQKKDDGNAFFKEDKFPQAVEAYTESIKRNPKEHKTYSNRAAAYLKLTAFSDALADCDKCLAIDPTFVKALARRGHAYFWLKDNNKALQAYDDGLKIDPNNAECREGRYKTMARIQEMASGEGDEETARRAMSNPEIQSIMNDSYMQLVLSEMQKNPARIGEYMKDPNISGKINKLIAAGIIRVGNESDQPRGGAARRR